MNSYITVRPRGCYYTNETSQDLHSTMAGEPPITKKRGELIRLCLNPSCVRWAKKEGATVCRMGCEKGRLVLEKVDFCPYCEHALFFGRV